ncbi:hypothetical protein BDZ89DRAFT_481494 [Hymenopellis radicata]|nr:hypothetical protein BDZ89DRAFT_481494 [Hymenopellis radicata]
MTLEGHGYGSTRCPHYAYIALLCYVLCPPPLFGCAVALDSRVTRTESSTAFTRSEICCSRKGRPLVYALVASSKRIGYEPPCAICC